MAFELNQRAELWNNGETETDLAPDEGRDHPDVAGVGNVPSVLLQRWTRRRAMPLRGARPRGRWRIHGLHRQRRCAGAVNDVAIADFLPGFAWPGGIIRAGLFVEALLNLSVLLEELNDCRASRWSTWMHTRASLSDSSNMDDLSRRAAAVRQLDGERGQVQRLNGDGDRDVGEPGLVGFRIWADDDNDGVLMRTSRSMTPTRTATTRSRVSRTVGDLLLREMSTPPATGTGGWICSQRRRTARMACPRAYTGTTAKRRRT